MREFSAVEHQYSSTMNNQPQNGFRGLIAEPVAVAVPALPAQSALTLCGMLSGLPHLFCHNIQGHCKGSQSLVPWTKSTIMRYRGYTVKDFVVGLV